MKYNVIYCDPPWTYENKKTGRTNGNQPEGSGAHTKYTTMTLDQLKAFPINDIAEKDCVLFMWSVVPLLPEALELMKAWGFKYKTKITWRKIMSLGMGYWFRGQVEDLLMGTRGNIKAFRCQMPNFIEHKVLEHSRKPDIFRHIIEESTRKISNRKMIELFARGDKTDKDLFNWNRFDGWATHGNEIQSDIKLAL